MEFFSAEIVENVPGLEHRFSKSGIEHIEDLQNPFSITKVETFGKMIKFDIETWLDQSWCAISTLGMSGSWAFNARKNKHARLAFITEDGKDLTFLDPRSYGSFRLVTHEESKIITSKIGWDLLKAPMPENQWAALQKNSKIKHKKVGPTLLEQNLFSGLGNIYRAESLYNCKIHPETRVEDIPTEKWAQLNIQAHSIMKRSYELGGTTIATFEADGHKGNNQVELQVYGQMFCPQDHPISRIEMYGRTMHFCDQCQILSKNDLFSQSNK